MSSAPRLQIQNPFLFDNNTFKYIHQLELRYAQLLLTSSSNFLNNFILYERLDHSYRRLFGFIKSLKSFHPKDGPLQKLLDDALAEINDRHHKNIFWITLYLDLTWPHDEDLPRRQMKRIRRHKIQIASSAQQSWSKLQSSSEDRIQALVSVKKDRDNLLSDSYLWRKKNQELIQKTHDLMASTLHEAYPSLVTLFQRHFYRHSAPAPLQQTIDDWALGYHKNFPEEAHLDQKHLEGLAKKINQSGHLIWLRNFLRHTALLLISLLAIHFIHSKQWDRNMYDGLTLAVKRLLRIDPLSLRLKMKQNFFHQYVVNIKRDIDPAALSREINRFNRIRPHYPEHNVYLGYARILRKYFMLLSDGSASRELSIQVYQTARAINPEMAMPVANIIDLFNNKRMYESDLRRNTLELRRIFVKHQVFPFMFIVIENELPYLFLFSEKIETKFEFSKENFERLGLNANHYGQFIEFPLKAYVVNGQSYPFKERAGYYEGEFAIVFSSIAPKTEWTAWHEIAHIIDDTRFMYGQKSLPSNIELNAVLFPLIFSSDPEIYVRDRLLPMIDQNNSRDNYVQSTKAVLNGFAVYLKDKISLPLISDKLEPDRIAAIKTQILHMPSQELKEAALLMFKNPQKYLSTAKGGLYTGVFQNAEEIISGSHGAPQQGFMLTNYKGFSRSTGSGPQFFRDGDGEDTGLPPEGFFDFIFRIFTSIVRERGAFSPTSVLEGIAASIIAFIIIESGFISIHLIASPYRKKKFNGRSLEKIVKNIYTNNPWSDGISYGDSLGECALFKRIIDSQGMIDEELKKQIDAFHWTSDSNKRVLLDMVLTLAIYRPSQSQIIHKGHDFLFWIPFLGPWIARSSFIFDKQRAFEEREEFNRRLERLLKSITSQTKIEELKSEYFKIIQDYKTSMSFEDTDINFMDHLNEMKKQTAYYLNSWTRTTELSQPVLAHRFPYLVHDEKEFDHLDNYFPGDDIKYIDWKATAKSTNNVPKLRKYIGTSATRAAFLFDFRQIDKPEAREKIAYDLAQSLRALGQNGILRQLVFLMPNGQSVQARPPFSNLMNPHLQAQKIWMSVEEGFKKYEVQQEEHTLRGLKFYTPEENRRYHNSVRLTEFGTKLSMPHQNLDQISVMGLTIFMIGVTIQTRAELEASIPKNNQQFYWS